MRKNRGLWGAVVPTLLLGLVAACGGSPSGDDDDDIADAAPDRPDAAPRIPQGPHHTFVIDGIVMPTTAGEGQQLGLDIDEDGEVDNALGGVIALLSANGADINANVTDQIDEGDLLELIDVQATALDSATDVGVYVWKGANPQPLPCIDTSDTVCRRHLDGSGSFDVASDTPEDAMVFGAIDGGAFAGTRGVIELDIPLFVGDVGLTMEIIRTKIEADVTATSVAGKLGGAVTDEFIQTSLLPQLEVTFAIITDRDCGLAAPTCCVADTDGDTVVGLFDTDDSCTISLSELQDSVLLDAVLAPDLDILDEEGLDGTDGVADSLSLGITFTAVPGTYDIPDGL